MVDWYQSWKASRSLVTCNAHCFVARLVGGWLARLSDSARRPALISWNVGHAGRWLAKAFTFNFSWRKIPSAWEWKVHHWTRSVISPILFNAGLEHAMRKWKAKLFHHGVQLGHGNRLTNIRYADDLMLFATSSKDLIYMLETLIPELAACNWIRPKQKFLQRLRWTLLSLLMYVEKWYK